MIKEVALNKMVTGNDSTIKGGNEMAKESMVKVNGAVATKNRGGNSMLLENTEVRCHCLHCNAELTKKGRKYCNRDCYNASRKANTKSPVKESLTTKAVATETMTAKEPVSSDAVNKAESPINVKTVEDRVLFEKALKNMQKFGSALTLHRLKKLVEIAGEKAHVIRVGGGIVIYWFINNEGYMVYYAPGRLITYKKSDSKEMRASIKKLMAHRTFKDLLGIKEYIELAEKMKGGE